MCTHLNGSIVLQSLFVKDLLKVPTQCLGRESNPYSLRYKPIALSNQPPKVWMHIAQALLSSSACSDKTFWNDIQTAAMHILNWFQMSNEHLLE